MSLFSSFAILLVQIPAILLVTLVCGDLLERVRQPRVVGEIVGGLLLGPLALGRLSPAAFTFLFPPTRLEPLETAGKIGLILFLFLMGAELDLAALRKSGGAAFAITFGSVYLSFAFGASLAPELRIHFGFADTQPIVFLLFIGIAMSITALPVLARIIQDRKRFTRPVDTTVAATSLVSAAANDLLAWSLLAIALALVRGPDSPLLSSKVPLHLLLLIVFVATMLFVVRPLAKLLLKEGVATWALVIASIPFAILSGQISEALGVHAFFGAFLAGVCFPLRHSAWLQLEHALGPVVQITLPIFFALTGLRMDPAMLRVGNLGWLALILVAAVGGKFAGATLAARASGIRWRPAAQIGALLNTRGVVELIVLSIGFQQHILGPALYTLFVLMALLTTAMTSPLLDLLTPAHDAKSS
jgi:Kef-type K+ transport system membrane component KefB